jgi:hypothetical protein
MALINPQPGSSSIYDPSLPSRIALGQARAPQQTPDTISSPGGPGEGPQYNPSFGADTSPEAMGPVPPPTPISSILAGQVKPPPTGVYAPSFGPGAHRPVAAQPATTGAGPNVNGVFNSLPDNVFDGARNAPQTAQAPAPATPQGWNLFTALGQALSHLLGYNAQGQPQGMSGLVRNPVQAAPSQTAALRMPTPQAQAARYQGRTLLG